MSDINVGVCHEHERPYEGWCKLCEIIICPSCVWFGKHKKHDIVSLRDGAMFLRKQMDDQMQKGLLKKEFSECHVLEIREHNLLIEKHKADTVKGVEEAFKGIISTLKNRRNNIIQEINEKFRIEKEKVDNAEVEWSNKQYISEQWNQWNKENKEAVLLQSSKSIMDGLRRLNEKLNFYELRIFNDLDTSLYIEGKIDDDGDKIDKREYSLDEVVYGFSNYLQVLPPTVWEYKS